MVNFKIMYRFFSSASSLSSSAHSFDHCFPASSPSASSPVVLLHGEIGTPQFVSAFNVLWPQAEAGGIRLCLRHWIANEPAERVRLSGYGVQLAVKSTEYKAVDDTKVEEGSRKSEDEILEETVVEDVEGFVFKTLKSVYGTIASFSLKLISPPTDQDTPTFQTTLMILTGI